jgi:hypothetical protein
MTSYTNPYTGQTISPSQVGYESLTISEDTTLQWPVNGNTSNVVANIIEVTATTTGLSLIMPPAPEVSVGEATIIRNIGSNPFTVTDTSGNTIASIASGIADYIYLTSNSTVNGVWAIVTFGAGTSSANAATLAGYGLMAIGTTLNQAYTSVSIFSSYYVLPSDRASFLIWESGAGTFTMPSAADVGNNWFVMIRNGGTGVLTVGTTGTDTINGDSTAQLQIGESFVICSNGAGGYNTFGYGQSAEFFFTQLAKVVTGGTVTLTANEASNIIQEYTGVLTSNCTVILPPTVQLYSFQNKTSGSYSLTFSTGAVGASTITLAQNQTVIAICDGTNVYNSQTSFSGITSITLANGSASQPSLNFLGDTATGLYLVGSAQLGFAVGGTNGMTLTTTGLLAPVGIPGGTF